MTRDQLWNMEMFQKQFGGMNVDGIDMSENEVKVHRVAVNSVMANLGMKPDERAKVLHILGLVHRDELKPEYRPDPPIRMCSKKLHNIADPSTYRIRKTQSLFGDDHVCLACEQANKERLAKPRKQVS